MSRKYKANELGMGARVDFRVLSTCTVKACIFNNLCIKNPMNQP